MENEETNYQQALQETSVVCDRYAYSGVGYSAAKGLQIDWCLGTDRGLIRPDLVIFINVSSDEIKNARASVKKDLNELNFNRK